MNHPRILLSFFFVLLFLNRLQAQEGKQLFLDSLYTEIASLIDETWYLEETEHGFQVTFCRSCAEKYNQYVTLESSLDQELSRDHFFIPNKFDSISYFSTVSNSPIPQKLSKKERNEYLTELYSPTDILRFNIVIEDKWSEEEYNNVLINNNLLKKAILKESLYKSNETIFSDYRYWLPSNFWKNKTQDFDFFFERLPYTSLTMNKSIFIEHNKPFFFSKPMLVDKENPVYFSVDENLLELERIKTLKIIALALGIHDYRVVN